MAQSTELKIGDLITAHDAGIWKVIEIKKRFYKTETDIPSLLKNTQKVGDEYNSLVLYEKVCDFKGNKPHKQIIKQCDSSYCRLAEDYIKQREEILDKFKNIIKNERNKKEN